MNRLRHELRLFFVALQFLTRLPVPRWVGWQPAWLNACVRHFPLVGALVGAAGAAVACSALLAWPPLVAAALAVAATLWLTAAFHEDGLADSFDALLGAAPREKALAIMKDSRIGSYGALALGLVLGLKLALLALIAQRGAAPAAAALLGAHVLSRAAPLDVMYGLPYVSDPSGAKSKPLAESAGPATVLTGLAWSLPALLLLGWVHGPLSLGLAVLGWMLALGAMRRTLRRRLQGFTGDTLGATQQLCELALYLGLALRLP